MARSKYEGQSAKAIYAAQKAARSGKHTDYQKLVEAQCRASGRTISK